MGNGPMELSDTAAFYPNRYSPVRRDTQGFELPLSGQSELDLMRPISS
jgi:hypothetical protein